MSIAAQDYTERHKHSQRKNVQRFPRNINVHLIILLLTLLLNLNSESNKNTPILGLVDVIEHSIIIISNSKGLVYVVPVG